MRGVYICSTVCPACHIALFMLVCVQGCASVCIFTMGKRRHAKCGRKYGYQKGSIPANKGRKMHFEPYYTEAVYRRVTRDTFQSRIHVNKTGVFTFKDVDGSDTNVRPLRPLANKPKLVDAYVKPCSSGHPDLYTYKLYRPLDIQRMFNSENRNHLQFKEGCKGDLIFDARKSRKWGVCWIERLKCSKCRFKSMYHKLYEEINSSKPGRKAAKPNKGIQAGLKTTPISNNAMTRILIHANVIPPAISGMNKQANQVGDIISETNRKSMNSIRENLLVENALCGNKRPSLVRVESDKRYNNPLFRAEETPFQGGTQGVQLVVENNTSKKLVIGAEIENQLCSTGARLRNKGNVVECPFHSGTCTQTLPETETIGNECRSSAAAIRQVNETLTVSHYTADGDSRSHKGVDKAQQGKYSAIHLRDVRHLAKSLKRNINKAQFSANMFKGATKVNLRNRFAMSVKSRCISELKAAHYQHEGDITMIKLNMPKIIDTMTLCFNGYCGSECAKYSLVCNGSNNRSKLFLPDNVAIRMTDNDQRLFKACVNTFLGPESLELTRFLTSTKRSKLLIEPFLCRTQSLSLTHATLTREYIHKF